ncbi:hypothetical protein [Lysobacter arvi]|uniref:Uncharacterized protein n=1 Tax=Lysobacter arvi TaxID=3038776 RepID=A0ABU1C975_9GAMM|nr:hypothetical protein [Lysobacter arvi]MDR0181744.1 hypothetical protein [Lysobacter arvi]
MFRACRLAGNELSQEERFALLALRHRSQLFAWERALMAPGVMDRLVELGFTVFDGSGWEPTIRGSELIARLTGHDFSLIAQSDAVIERERNVD